MLPRAHLELAEKCQSMYNVAGEAVRTRAASISPAWLYQLTREIAERGDDLTRYELSADALTWNFTSMLYLTRWMWRTLEPPALSAPALEYTPWAKPAGSLSQIEFRDALRALAIRWSITLPCYKLWDWIDQLDRRAADLCSRSDLGELLDEDYREIDGCRVAGDEFVTDTAAIMSEMLYARFAHRDFLQRVGRIWRPPEGLPTEGARAWLARERGRFTEEARESIEGELARFGSRPGEIARFARARQGIIPDDLRAVMRYCRPHLSDYRKEIPMEPYLVFGRVCQRRSFDWLPLALLTERDYFRETEDGVRYCDVMFSIREPTVFRLMGADYVYYRDPSGEEPRRAWRCASPEEALCLWIKLVSPRYQLDNVQWNLDFLKKAYVVWRDGEDTRQKDPVLV